MIMQEKIMKGKKIATLIFVGWLLTGCQHILVSTAPSTNVRSNNTSTPRNMTLTTVTIEVSKTPVPTSASVSSTSIPQVTAMLELSPSPTQIPIAIPDTTKETLEIFVKENGGCHLPCVWGITPEVSTISEVDAFVNYFQQNTSAPKVYSDFADIDDYIQYLSEKETDSVDISSHIEENWGGVSFAFWESRIRVNTSLTYYSNKEHNVSQLIFTSGVFEHFGDLIGDNVRTLMVHPYYDELLGQFHVSSILTTYGPPSELLIRPFPTYPEHPDWDYPFVFVLLYSKQGFLVEYISARDETAENYVGCPQKAHIDISTWYPDNPMSLKQAVQYFSGIYSIQKSNVDRFQSINEVSDMNIDDFYATFKDSNTDECVITPKSLWNEQP
jgi:hypothetical protein